MSMKKINNIIVVLLVVLVTVSSCKKDDEVNVMTDAQFMQFAAVSGLFEIQSSELATQKGSTQQLIDFANHMITDHMMQDQELKSLAAQKNITLPATLTPEKQAIVTKLNGLGGAAFEKEYMNEQIKSHEETVKNFEMASTSARDADVKTFASKYLPALRMHLDHARSVKTVTDAL
jgi:putative membrane protein